MNGENKKTSRPYLQTWTKVLGHFCICGAFSTQTYPTPPPPHKQRWTRLSRMFSEFQHCVRREKEEMQLKLEKDALFNEGSQK